MHEEVQTQGICHLIQDEEMTQLMATKTEAIQAYARMIEKWMENYNLKQQYLGSLKKEFIADSHTIKKMLQKLS